MRCFFFYGTLIAGCGNPVAEIAHERLLLLGPAVLRGRLHAIRDPGGWYPALVRGPGLVRGLLYAASPGFTADDVARLDRYEGNDLRHPAASLYVRERVRMVAGQGPCDRVEAYRYNRPLPASAPRIVGGDFRAWLERTGRTAYAELR